MKRRYKAGDWLRIPLRGEVDALAIITQAVRSRLFGYFFPVAFDRQPSGAELSQLTTRDAVMCALFGGTALEDARWTIVAASLPLRAEQWPFPDFALRGAFGRTWQRVTYDPGTMSVRSTHFTEAAAVCDLPDARFATPSEIEGRLRARLGAVINEPPLTVYEIAPGFDPAQLSSVAPAGRVQLRMELSKRELEVLAEFFNRNPGIELRVVAPSGEFDAGMLSNFTTLRRLILDTPHLRGAQALASLTGLESVRTWASCERTALCGLPRLRAVELVGCPQTRDPIEKCPHLQTITFTGGVPERLDQLAACSTLRELTIRHTPGVPELRRLRALRSLELSDVRAERLPDLRYLTHLSRVALERVGPLRDLRELAAVSSLRELSVRAMPQLDPANFLSFRECATLPHLDVDLGSRRKNREVYRMLRAGMIRS